MNNEFYPDRLSWIRKKRGMNKTALAAEIGVDLRSISAYESGEYEPTPETRQLLAAVLRVDGGFFGRGVFVGPDANQVSFRSLSKLSAAKRDMALGSVAIAFEFNEWLKARFNLPEPDVPDLREERDPEQAAMSLRYLWGLGEKPISNMIHLLESKGIRVFSLSLEISEIDACCTWRDGDPYVFLNTKKSHARRRFDAAHELGHLVLHRHGDYDLSSAEEGGQPTARVAEREADEFASAFLMPRGGFAPTAPRLPSLANIVPAKLQWGVSVAAYIVRLHRIGLIRDWHYRTLFQQISQKGYRRNEPIDCKTEMSKIAELILNDLRKDNFHISDVASSLGVSTKDLEDLLFDIAIFPVDSFTKKTHVSRSRGTLRLVIDNNE